MVDKGSYKYIIFWNVERQFEFAWQKKEISLNRSEDIGFLSTFEGSAAEGTGVGRDFDCRTSSIPWPHCSDASVFSMSNISESQADDMMHCRNGILNHDKWNKFM